MAWMQNHASNHQDLKETSFAINYSHPAPEQELSIEPWGKIHFSAMLSYCSGCIFARDNDHCRVAVSKAAAFYIQL